MFTVIDGWVPVGEIANRTHRNVTSVMSKVHALGLDTTKIVGDAKDGHRRKLLAVRERDTKKIVDAVNKSLRFRRKGVQRIRVQPLPELREPAVDPGILTRLEGVESLEESIQAAISQLHTKWGITELSFKDGEPIKYVRVDRGTVDL